MARRIEPSDELVERLRGRTEEDETVAEFLEELVSIYEQEGRFLQGGL